MVALGGGVVLFNYVRLAAPPCPCGLSRASGYPSARHARGSC